MPAVHLSTVLLLFSVTVSAAYRYDDAVRCNIEVQSYSLTEPCVKPVEGFIKLNGRRVWEAGCCDGGVKPRHRGVTITTVDPITCTPGNFYTFDTYAVTTAATDLANYLLWLPSDSVVVGVTGDEPSKMLSAALPVLKIAGVHVSDVQIRGNFAFVLQKGYPSKTQFVKSITNGVPISKLSINVVGTTSANLQIVTISRYNVRLHDD